MALKWKYVCGALNRGSSYTITQVQWHSYTSTLIPSNSQCMCGQLSVSKGSGGYFHGIKVISGWNYLCLLCFIRPGFDFEFHVAIYIILHGFIVVVFKSQFFFSSLTILYILAIGVSLLWMCCL